VDWLKFVKLALAASHLKGYPNSSGGCKLENDFENDEDQPRRNEETKKTKRRKISSSSSFLRG
jgi:hypothetical protein